MLQSAERSEVEAFLKTVARATKSALLLDYDGTLAPFRTRRDQAFPYPGVVEVLQEILKNGRTQMFIVSGRRADEVIPLLGIYPFPEVWGLHGLQRRKQDGSEEMACLDEDLVQALIDADRWLTKQDIRRTAEFKPGSIAVHWRGLSAREADEIKAKLLLGWSQIARRAAVRLLDFDGGIELRAPKPDKGTAVRGILSELMPGTPVAYLGDDTTDEHAFQALEHRGLRVLVRPTWRKTEAEIWLKPPRELLDFLERWLEATQEQAGGVAAQ